MQTQLFMTRLVDFEKTLTFLVIEYANKVRQMPPPLLYQKKEIK